MQVMLFGMDEAPEFIPLAFRHVEVLPVHQHHPSALTGGAMQPRADRLFVSLDNPCCGVDGMALCQCPHGKFEKFWISFEPKVRWSVRHGDPLTTGLTQRLFLSMTGAILHQPALAKRPTIAGARPIGAIESFPVHRILGWLSIFRSNKDTDWLLSQPLSSRKLRDTT
jgi:hypothetical protein